MARFMLAAAAFMPAAISFMLAPPAQAAEVTALLDFLAAPGTIKIMKAKGLEPAS